ncbi:type II CRISPR-associated endonuclease Cas1 [Uruburuella testudinis]|uniref:CRISPR-associated endonuclease Cas1 n=1 Tax=Uruburuella testudinis TaxID=1282863 RepID=A0ABY4DW33_9NEIS|nr:type II CRISPR-associated endonuclease Cas1 [Uruburuella testudinis]UOO82254.1 type II CRISPR-associated endonuclease Cas1 [Uruburuella testudinis]
MSVVEISEQSVYLHTERGFLLLAKGQQEVSRIDLDHITAIIAKAHGLTYSHNLLVKLSERNIPLVLTDSSFMPVSIIQPVAVHHAPVPVLAAQIAATNGQNNLLWQKIIQAKIKMQAAVLNEIGLPDHDLLDLRAKVSSGDRSNVEAQAARKYWVLLFGQAFRRHQYGEQPNSLLNYGYTILRSTLAREICAAGLHPAIGIHHKHRHNAFCLADDLIEPFRPLVDYTVYQLVQNGHEDLCAHSKKILVDVLERLLRVDTRWQTVANSMQILSQSLAKSYLNNNQALKLPKSMLKRFI